MSTRKSSEPIEAVDRRHLSDSAVLDPDSLDPNLHYRFVQHRPTQVARAKMAGYRIVSPTDSGVKTIHDQEDGHPENVIKHGDRVLMATPKAKHKQNRDDLRRLTNQRLESNSQRVKELAKEKKVKLFDKDEEDD
jgi:hypothetical protein